MEREFSTLQAIPNDALIIDLFPLFLILPLFRYFYYR